MLTWVVVLLQVLFPMQLSYAGYPVSSILSSMSTSMSVGLLGSVEKEK